MLMIETSEEDCIITVLIVPKIMLFGVVSVLFVRIFSSKPPLKVLKPPLKFIIPISKIATPAKMLASSS